MIRFESTQTIERSADAVWAYATDVLRHPEWMDVIDARLVSGTSTEVGARASEHLKLGPTTVEQEFEVTDAVPGRSVAWRMLPGGALAGEARLDLEAVGPDRTQAVWSGSLGLTGWRRLLEPLMRGEVMAGEAAELRRLKEILEAGA